LHARERGRYDREMTRRHYERMAELAREGAELEYRIHDEPAVSKLLASLRESADEAERARLRQRIDALRSTHRVVIDPERRALAEQVLARDPFAFDEAIAASGCLLEVRGHVGADGLRVTFEGTSAHADVRAPVGEAVQSMKDAWRADVLRSVAEELDVYQDYVCGLSLRVARELLATLPLDEVVVDLWSVRASQGAGGDADAGGYRVAVPHAISTRIVSICCPRAAMESVAWGTADASEVVDILAHEMDFRPGEGFFEVPQIRRS
jgi:hypothetical protein